MNNLDMIKGDVSEMVRLLLRWGRPCIKTWVLKRRLSGKHELANLLESQLGGRRCEIVNLSSRPELNGKACVVDQYLRDNDQYKVTLETKGKEVSAGPQP